MIKFLLDEHIPLAYRDQLLYHDPDLVVYAIGDYDAPPKGTLDREILLWCEANDFILVTNNRKSMPRHLDEHLKNDHHIPGILTIDLSTSMGRLLETLILIAHASFSDEFQDQIVYIAPL